MPKSKQQYKSIDPEVILDQKEPCGQGKVPGEKFVCKHFCNTERSISCKVTGQINIKKEPNMEIRMTT